MKSIAKIILLFFLFSILAPPFAKAKEANSFMLRQQSQCIETNDKDVLNTVTQLMQLTESENILSNLADLTLKKLIIAVLPFAQYAKNINISNRANRILNRLEPKSEGVKSDVLIETLLDLVGDPNQNLKIRIAAARYLLDYCSMVRTTDFRVKNDSIPRLQFLTNSMNNSKDEVGSFLLGVLLLKAWYDFSQRTSTQESSGKTYLSSNQKEEYKRMFRLAEKAISLQTKASYNQEMPNFADFKALLEEKTPPYILMNLGMVQILDRKLKEATRKLRINNDEVKKVKDLYDHLNHYVKKDLIIFGETKIAISMHRQTKELFDKISHRYASIFSNGDLWTMKQLLWRNSFLTNLGHIIIFVYRHTHWLIRKLDQLRIVLQNKYEKINPKDSKLIRIYLLIQEFKNEKEFRKQLLLGQSIIDILDDPNFIIEIKKLDLKKIIYFGIQLLKNKEEYISAIGHGILQVLQSNIRAMDIKWFNKVHRELEDSINKTTEIDGSISKVNSLKTTLSITASNITLLFKRYILPSVLLVFIAQRSLAFDGHVPDLEWTSILPATLFLIISSLIVIHLGHHNKDKYNTEKNISLPYKFWTFFGIPFTFLIFNQPAYAMDGETIPNHFSTPTEQTASQLMNQMQNLLGKETPIVIENVQAPSDRILINAQDILEESHTLIHGLKDLIEKIGDADSKVELAIVIEDNLEIREKIEGILKQGELYSKFSKVQFMTQKTIKSGEYNLRELLLTQSWLIRGDYTLWVIDKNHHWSGKVEEILRNVALRPGLELIHLKIQGLQAVAVSQ